nr:unnamed protein product [Spirometra erinaceieuropaei]
MVLALRKNASRSFTKAGSIVSVETFKVPLRTGGLMEQRPTFNEPILDTHVKGKLLALCVDVPKLAWSLVNQFTYDE